MSLIQGELKTRSGCSKAWGSPAELPGQESTSQDDLSLWCLWAAGASVGNLCPKHFPQGQQGVRGP